MPRAEALREAKAWLRSLTLEEVQRQVARLPVAARGKVEERKPGTVVGSRPFAHPFYWSAFILLGDPG
jgi:CHAT domain-containing protein